MALIRRRPVPAIARLDYGAGLAAARTCMRQGASPEAFDRYELLTQWYPGQCIETLAELYDAYQQLPDKESRYFLYQSRHFDFVIDPADKVLDVGSGNNPFPFATHLADIALTDDRYGRAGAPFKTIDGRKVYECNIESMPFDDGEFDLVFCSHVLEHVLDPARACEEIMRVGKRGYIETPTRSKDLWLNSGPASNHRWYVERDGETLLFTEYSPRELAGFSCDILMNMHCVPQTTREKAFSALVILKSDLINTMFAWEDRFTYAVRRNVPPLSAEMPMEKPQSPAFPMSRNTGDASDRWWFQSLVRHPFFTSNGRILFAGSDFVGLLDLLPASMVDNSQFFCPSGTIPAVSRPLPQASLIFGRLEKLPYENDSFDRSVLADSFKAGAVDTAASELWRVTRSGGQALAIVPSALAPAFSKEIANRGAANIDEFSTDKHIALVFEKPGTKPASAKPEAEAKPLQSRENPQSAAASIDPAAYLSRGYLDSVGWLESFRRRIPVDRKGAPLPWFTYASILFLEPRILPAMSVFEYGCGCSTLWWASRVATVFSCEHEKEWFDKIKPLLPPSVSLRQVDLVRGGEYCRVVADYTDAFDIIVIDGRDRVNCCRNSLGALKPGGAIIWDNSDRPDYREGYDFLRDKGFKRLDFGGMGPINPDAWCTSVFYRPKNCLGI